MTVKFLSNMKKKQTKKNKGCFDKITFMYDYEYGIDIKLGGIEEAWYLGIPVKFFTKGKTLVVDMSQYLLFIRDRINSIEDRIIKNK